MKNLFKKKLILVLTLIFLSGCATTSVDQVVENSPQELENQNLVFIGQSKKEFCWARTSIWYAVMCYKYDALGKQPFMYYENKNYEERRETGERLLFFFYLDGERNSCILELLSQMAYGPTISRPVW